MALKPHVAVIEIGDLDTDSGHVVYECINQILINNRPFSFSTVTGSVLDKNTLKSSMIC